MSARARAQARAALVKHLLWARIAGEVATPRENNLHHLKALADGDPYYHFGLDLDGRWSDSDTVLEMMAERCGISDDPEHTHGQDTIDPELTVNALDRVAARLKQAAEGRQRVLLATGHPAGLMPLHQAVGRALRRAGCELAIPPDGILTTEGEVRHLDGVVVLHRGGNLMHTHSPVPMQRILDVMQMDDRLPDLVHADHGWAGCSGQRGIETVGYADCNDPALFVGEADGRLLATVPLDDNVPPHRYQPVIDYLLTAAGLEADAPIEPPHLNGRRRRK
ncbi:phosphatase [Mangrovactinospora gilvigrisea]|uniref:Phosphatase n=1 Tax=Mangrovactinospora gilvigrisea TaxID=1428644 RepID=A0A1J7BFP9_9ACTN|nr:phosphatase [Mangrovactinospora gilvigrisea]OIV37507.1 phosphatase [Mangrovactinospora gilvigrisea]